MGGTSAGSGLLGKRSAGGAVADDLEAVTGDMKTVGGPHLGDLRGEALAFDISNGATAEAARVKVVVRPRVVSGRAVPVRKLHRQVAGDERLESLVYRGEGDVRDLAPDGGKDLVGGWVVDGATEESEDGRPLLGKALAMQLQGALQHFIRVFRGRLGGKAHESDDGRNDPFSSIIEVEQVASVDSDGS